MTNAKDVIMEELVKVKVDRIPDGFHSAIKTILEYIGEDPNREGLKETPNRVLKAYDEMLCGYRQDPISIMKCFSEDTCSEMVSVRNVSFFAFCEHHLLPFFGKAIIAYVPDGRIIGLSKLARVFDIYAKRLQVQERLTIQVTQALMEHLKPKGAACRIQATHLCMCARGVHKEGAEMVTCSLEGIFREDARTRAEFLDLARS